MAIPIRQPPDPDSRLSFKENDLIFMESEAVRQLACELRGYCEGKNNGRSYLIAGHRGAGKTTLVHVALRIAQDRDGPGIFGTLPVLVSLQGPTLFGTTGVLPPPPTASLSPNNISPASAVAAPPTPGSLQTGSVAPGAPGIPMTKPANGTKESAPPLPDLVLGEITLALHRAVVDVMIRRLQAGIEETYAALRQYSSRKEGSWWSRLLGYINDAVPSSSSSERLEQSRYELHAMAAQLELELDEFPDSARLHEFWRRLGRLRTGILDWRGRAGSDQGIREIVALTSLNEARRRVSGKLTSEMQGSESGERKGEINLAGEMGELTKVIASLLAGATAVVGVHATIQTGSAGSILAGLVTAIGTLFVFKYSASWSQKRTVDRKELFLPDQSSATLERVLPVLIERLRAAGLAPVFVVDELDKVDDLDKRLAQIIPRLKKLVAERSFFCFIADRSYFEAFRSLSADHNYVKEYTFFTHRLFVTYSPKDFHDYLRRIMNLPVPGTVAPTPPATVPPSSNSSPPSVAATPETSPAPSGTATGAATNSPPIPKP